MELHLNDPIHIVTPRLTIRPYTTEDFPAYFAYIMEPELQDMLGLHDVTDRKSAKAVFDWLMRSRTFLALIDNRSHQAIGHICIHPPYAPVADDPCYLEKRGCSLSFAIAKEERRKRLTEESLRALMTELFECRAFDYIDCEAVSRNDASLALQKKLGFAFWGREALEGEELLIHVLENHKKSIESVLKVRRSAGIIYVK